MVKSMQISNNNNVHQYLVVGRALPTEKDKNPKIYKMRIFAQDTVRAKSKFWYYLRKMNKIKKAIGEVLSVNEVNYFIIRFLKKIHLKLKIMVLFVPICLSSVIILYIKNSEVLL